MGPRRGLVLPDIQETSAPVPKGPVINFPSTFKVFNGHSLITCSIQNTISLEPKEAVCHGVDVKSISVFIKGNNKVVLFFVPYE